MDQIPFGCGPAGCYTESVLKYLSTTSQSRPLNESVMLARLPV